MSTTKRVITREIFNPENKDHLRSFKTFLKTGSWGKIHFEVEQPYVTVPETVFRKYALHTLKKI